MTNQNRYDVESWHSWHRDEARKELEQEIARSQPLTVDLGEAHVAEIELVTNLKGATPPRVQITLRWRPDRTAVLAFRPERLELEDLRFDVHDIRIGNRSQLAQCGALPGDMFGASVVESFVWFDTMRTAMYFDLVVAYPYEGPDVAIRSIRAKLHGLAAMVHGAA